jgi:hypothetical protein
MSQIVLGQQFAYERIQNSAIPTGATTAEIVLPQSKDALYIECYNLITSTFENISCEIKIGGSYVASQIRFFSGLATCGAATWASGSNSGAGLVSDFRICDSDTVVNGGANIRLWLPNYRQSGFKLGTLEATFSTQTGTSRSQLHHGSFTVENSGAIEAIRLKIAGANTITGGRFSIYGTNWTF